MDIGKLKRLKERTTGKLVVSPRAVVRWEDRRILISSGGVREAVATSDARLLQVLHAFAAPREPREVEDELKHLGGGFLFSSISALWHIDALVVADEEGENGLSAASSIEEGEAAGQVVLAEVSNRSALEHAQAIAVLNKEIACDLAGFGAYAHDAAREREGGRASFTTRLGDVHRTLERVALELREMRAPYLDTQLSRLRLSGASKNLRLHLGSGASRLEGWVNVDVPPAELSMNLGWALPFADDSAECVYLSHVLEHFYKKEALDLLTEAHRVLAPSGVVRVVVPDAERLMRAYVERDEEFFETRGKLWTHANESCATPLELVLDYAGAGIKPGNFWGHKHAYDFETLRHTLRQAGFAKVERSTYMQSSHPALPGIDAAGRVAGFKHRDSYFSLFVEATK